MENLDKLSPASRAILEAVMNRRVKLVDSTSGFTCYPRNAEQQAVWMNANPNLTPA